MKTTYEEVEGVYLSFRSNVRNKNSISTFEANYHANLYHLVNQINHGYKYHNYHVFKIYDPKLRIIMSETLEDKIVNHLVCYKILSKLDKYLIDSNCATRVGRGTSYARHLLDRYLVQLKNKHDKFYILKFDIHKYFYSIDHNVLLNKLKRYLSREELIEISKILDTTNHLDISDYSYGKGLPIGNMTSQILAIFYLNEIDHFIKEKLGCKYFIRYMDDGIILLEDKERLREIKDILIEKIEKEYLLKVNSKTKIYTSKEGFTFLGIRYFIAGNKIIRRIPSIKKNRIIKKLNYNNYSSYLPLFRYTRQRLKN